MRALITGATGFAGRHLAEECAKAGDAVVAWSSADVDLRDAAATRAGVEAVAPDVVYHLAARAHVGRSWSEPAATLQENVAMTLNVLEAVRTATPRAVVVAVSSGEVYGRPEGLPVAEDAALRPANPYAVSKAAADLLAGFYADAHGLCVVRPRAFNHAGPGQDASYAVAAFARQVVEGAVAGARRVRVVTGNPDTRRDYTDVRDVVRAYRGLAARGEPGVFNVCSGRTASGTELVDTLARLAGVDADIVVDPSLVRPSDVLEVRGDFSRLRTATGWAPGTPLERTLADTLAWWRARFGASSPDPVPGRRPDR